MRTLVIADIHLNFVRAQRVIDSVPHDKLVLTGDYFDAYSSTVTQTENTAVWLKENILHNQKVVALLGNHDTTYVFNNRNFICSGYFESYAFSINNILNESDKSKFRVYHIDQGFVFSHAGLSNYFWKKYSSKFEKSEEETKLQFFDRVMSVYSKDAIIDASNGLDVELFAAGWDRGGINRVGGINWIDWHSFAPINGINQIVGHTTHRIPQILVQYKGGGFIKQDITEYNKNNKETLSINYNLDTHLNHYAVIEDGKMDVFHLDTNLNLRDVPNYHIAHSEMNNLM